MAHDENHTIWRFFSYLSLFSFAMLMLVTADNLLQLFFGWEGVGLACLPADRLLVLPADAPVPRRSRRSSSTASAICASRSASRWCSSCSARSSSRTMFGAVGAHQDATYHVLGAYLARLRGDRHPAVHRRDGQIGADRPACLAARRDGGADAGLRPDPCRDDGDGRRVPDGALLAGAGLRARRAGFRHIHRRHDGAVRGDDRLRAERHQAGDRLFHLLAARLHVRRRRRRRLSGVDLPSADARLLQGAAVPDAPAR